MDTKAISEGLGISARGSGEYGDPCGILRSSETHRPDILSALVYKLDVTPCARKAGDISYYHTSQEWLSLSNEHHSL